MRTKGLSGILCARPISSLADEPFAEDDGELGLGLELSMPLEFSPKASNIDPSCIGATRSARRAELVGVAQPGECRLLAVGARQAGS